MKIWECGGQNVICKGDTARMGTLPTGSNDSTIRRLIDQCWPDNETTFWKRTITRSGALCVSSEAQDWQCGSFGPGGKFCQRPRNHVGTCCDFFLPVDRKKINEEIDELRQEEFEAFLGKRPTRAHNYDLKKLKRILSE
jgi:hypothetical protein